MIPYSGREERAAFSLGLCQYTTRQLFHLLNGSETFKMKIFFRDLKIIKIFLIILLVFLLYLKWKKMYLLLPSKIKYAEKYLKYNPILWIIILAIYLFYASIVVSFEYWCHLAVSNKKSFLSSWHNLIGYQKIPTNKCFNV